MKPYVTKLTVHRQHGDPIVFMDCEAQAGAHALLVYREVGANMRDVVAMVNGWTHVDRERVQEEEVH